jgi:RimJ/RimL family protein N-acetyltransferase
MMENLEKCILESERLWIRPVSISDAEALFLYRSEPETAAHLSKEPKTVQDVVSFIEQCASSLNQAETWFQVVVLEKEGNQIIGDIGLHFLADENIMEIGYTLGKNHRGRGYASEAVKRVVQFAFETLNKKEIIASVDPNNTPSIKLLERIGFHKKSHSVKSLFFKGEWVDDVVYALHA